MQTVLSLDTSCSPAIGVVAQISGNSVEVLERHEVIFDDAASFEQILVGAAPIPAASSNARIEHPTDFQTTVTNALVILPPLEYLSTVLFLPFSDPKQLGRIVESELQDLVPFDTTEFVLHYRVVGQRPDGNFAVHVAAIPRTIVANALAACQSRGIDPVVLTTPESILQAVASLRADGPETVLYCYISDRFAHVALSESGVVILDRTIDRTAPYTNGSHGGSVSLESLLYRVKLELGAMERRAEKKISKVIFVDSVIDTSPVSTALGCPVELVNSCELLKDATSPNALAVMGALLADDSRASTVLTNFRVNEFSFRPPLKELIGALKLLAPYFLIAVLLGIAYITAAYFLTATEISSLNSAAAKHIAANAAGLPLSPGNEVKSLSSETSKIQDELKDLGSPESYSPLETLALLSTTIPSIPEVTVDRVDIKGNRVTVEGCAPNYGAVETIENTLEHSALFANVKKQSMANCSGGRPNGRGFKFELGIQE